VVTLDLIDHLGELGLHFGQRTDVRHDQCSSHASAASHRRAGLPSASAEPADSRVRSVIRAHLTNQQCRRGSLSDLGGRPTRIVAAHGDPPFVAATVNTTGASRSNHPRGVAPTSGAGTTCTSIHRDTMVHSHSRRTGQGSVPQRRGTVVLRGRR
jgi:short subunit dehydrogenase-like uncharacterized protein